MKRAKVAGLAFAMLTLGIVSPAAAAGTDSPRMGDVQRALSELAESPEVAGVIGALYVDGREVGRGTAGTRLIGGEGGRIPPGARFRVGSQTKLMTQVVIMQLVGEGRLSLDDGLGDVLPVVAEKDLVERAADITVEQLIHHTSGIPEFYSPEHGIDPFDFTTRYSPLEVVALSRKWPRTGEPGERFVYTNTNYFLLGLIIEEVTKRKVAAEFERRVFGPVGMDDTYLPVRWPGGIKGPHAHGYHPGKNGRPVDVDRLNMSYGYAAGGVISTTGDITAFHRAFAGGKLLSKELKDALNAGRPPQDPGQPAPEPPACGRADGYGLAKGGSLGFTAMTYLSRDGRVQLAMSVTAATAFNDPALDALIRKAAEAVLCPGG
ncbi:serine hydrolase domain-containing protein [Nonomuraea sp. NPDC050643]|uniref:serine hydrolase domain-containing protein n=1 Tax=Nonomuraea sp. NPDC050643 TaxID=3155660 RepID=UPI0034029124